MWIRCSVDEKALCEVNMSSWGEAIIQMNPPSVWWAFCLFSYSDISLRRIIKTSIYSNFQTLKKKWGTESFSYWYNTNVYERATRGVTPWWPLETMLFEGNCTLGSFLDVGASPRLLPAEAMKGPSRPRKQSVTIWQPPVAREKIYSSTGWQVTDGSWCQSLWNWLLRPLSHCARDQSVTPWKQQVAKEKCTSGWWKVPEGFTRWNW